jgi:hypothetical protein
MSFSELLAEVEAKKEATLSIAEAEASTTVSLQFHKYA